MAENQVENFELLSAPLDTSSVEKPPLPDNYLVWSLLVTIFCCNILGVISIIYGSKVATEYIKGNYEASMQASKQAKLWIIATAILGVVMIVFYTLFLVFYAEELKEGTY